MSRTAPPPVADAVLIGRVAELLSDLGEEGLTEALELLVDELSLSSAVLREAAPHGLGRVRAVAGDSPHAVPAMRVVSAGSTPGPTVELPLRAGGRDVGVLAVVGARPSQLPALRGVASVLGLVLSSPAARPAVDDAVLELVAAADAEADAAADLLHDGPVQSLVVAHYAAEAAARGGNAVAAREAVQSALVELRRTLWHLRPRTGSGLAGALGQLSARMEEAGGAPLRFVLDEVLAAALPPAVVSVAYRVVQAVAVPAGAEPVRVALRREGALVVLDVEGGTPLAEPQRWGTTARALGGSLTCTPDRIRLAVPVPVAPRPRSKASS
jgi:hypothetical protein